MHKQTLHIFLHMHNRRHYILYVYKSQCIIKILIQNFRIIVRLSYNKSHVIFTHICLKYCLIGMYKNKII